MAPKPSDETPFIVRFATMGRPTTRKRMLMALGLMLALTALAIIVWLGNPESASNQFLLVVALTFAAAELLAIRWIDKNGTWEPD